MANQIRAHINLAGRGSHEYVCAIAFDNPNSDSLRIKEIRLKPTGNDKPLRLSVNLLSWFTKQIAGREVSRDDNEQMSKVALYTDLSVLRELIDTCALTSPFTLELEISELDRNDDIQLRSDNGIIEIEINLYQGPGSPCSLHIEPLVSKAAPAIFPVNCGADGRFDLAKVIITSDESPLNPLTDKRMMLCYVELSKGYTHLNNMVEKRLKCFAGDREHLSEPVTDIHHYSELYPSFPLDSGHLFPSSAIALGPLLPSDAKQQPVELTISMTAPLQDPLWQILREEVWREQFGNTQKSNTLLGELIVLIPQPGATIEKRIPFAIAETRSDCLLIADAAGRTAPLSLELNFAEDRAGDPIEFPLKAPLTGSPGSTMLSIEYYCPTRHDQSINIAFKPDDQASKTHIIKPEVQELYANQRQLLLLNRISDQDPSKTGTDMPTTFDVRIFMAENERKHSFPLQIAYPDPTEYRQLAIDIGSSEITLATNLDATDPDQSQRGSPILETVIRAKSIPSNVSLTGSIVKSGGKVEETPLIEKAWRVKKYPFSLSMDAMNQGENALAERLVKQQRHYDIALPALDDDRSQLTVNNLKGLLLAAPNHLETEKGVYVAVAGEDDKSKKSAAAYLMNDVNIDWLTEDCLDEIGFFHASYLSSTKNDKTINAFPTELILTHSAETNSTTRARYKRAARKFLARYESGSFSSLGAIGELIGLPSPSSLAGNVSLLSDALAGAYYALKARADNQRPARSKKINQIHIDVGATTCEITAHTAYIGESYALLSKVLGEISLPMGGQTLEVALSSEISNLIADALASTPLIELKTEFPLTENMINSAANPLSGEERVHASFLSALRAAIKNHQTGQSSHQSGMDNDLMIVMATSDRPNSILSINEKNLPEPGSTPLWQGLRGEQLIFTRDEAGKNWHVELHLSTKIFAERVGPLSTYLGFVGDFLPRVIAESMRGDEPELEIYFSMTGGYTMFAPLQHKLVETAKKLGCAEIFTPIDSREARSAVALGALSFLAAALTPPIARYNPNLILTLASAEMDTRANRLEDLAKTNIHLIQSRQASGEFSQTPEILLLIETIPGLNELVKKHPEALSCRTYLEDLDRAKEHQWQAADNQWQVWLGQCHQLLLNMNLSSTGTSGKTSWTYQALTENEARFVIAGYDYMLSSGLKATGR